MKTRQHRRPPTGEECGQLKRIHEMLGKELAGSKMGFALLCFDPTQGGFVQWSSNNANRSEMAKLLRETVDRLEASVANDDDVEAELDANEKLATCVHDVRRAAGIGDDVPVADLPDAVAAAMAEVAKQSTCRALERVQHAGAPVAEHTMLLSGIRGDRFNWDRERRDWINRHTGTPHERG